MSRQWMPLYIADYKKDTGHLSTLQHGAYMLLIMHYWATGGLPDDDKQLARIACMSIKQWQRTKPVIVKLFGEHWRHKRIDAELARAAEISNKRKAAAEQKHSKSSANAPANAEQLHTQSQSQRKKEDTADAVTSIYVFECGVIRLTKKNFDQWKDAFSYLDLKAELIALAEWAGQQKNWFPAVAGALNKKNAAAKLALEREKNQAAKAKSDFYDPMASIY